MLSVEFLGKRSSHVPIFQQEEGGFYGLNPDGSANGEVYFLGKTIFAMVVINLRNTIGQVGLCPGHAVLNGLFSIFFSSFLLFFFGYVIYPPFILSDCGGVHTICVVHVVCASNLPYSPVFFLVDVMRSILHLYLCVSSNGSNVCRACVCVHASCILGIIDILQQYNGRKWGENLFRKMFSKEGAKGLTSAVPPRQYAQRFIQFIKDNTE